MVVLSQYGCTTTVMAQVPPGCGDSRGELFNLNGTSTWREQGTYPINDNGIGLGGSLGYELVSHYGVDTIGLGTTGPVLENQTVAGFFNAEPLYL
jgi:hypothetical protein